METKIIYEKDFYVDHISVLFNDVKVSMDMHSIHPVSDISNSQNVQSVVVRHNVAAMSPLLAKDLLNTLKKTIDEYEEKFGKIKMPKEMNSKNKEKSENTYFG